MLAILYLAVAVWLGDVLCRRFLAFASVIHRASAAIVVGILVSTWITYLAAAAFPRAPQPLLIGNLLFATLAGAVIFLLRGGGAEWRPRPPGRGAWDLLVLGGWTAFTTWMMFSSLGLQDGVLRMGGRQWSDFGATLAIVQSFAFGNNFPPEYPHFPGPPLAYHFLFHFQAGNLVWLGLKLPMSFNVLSIVSVAAMVGLLMTLGERLFQSRVVGRLGASLFFFHGSLAYVPYFKGRGSVREAIAAVFNQRDFLESLWPYRSENWGIWTLNIIANQRHLALAIATLVLVLVFLTEAYEWRLQWPKPRRRLPEPPPAPAEPIAPLALASEGTAAVEDARSPDVLADGPPDLLASGDTALPPVLRDAAIAAEVQADAPPETSPDVPPGVPPDAPLPAAPVVEPELPRAPAPVPGGTSSRLFASFCFAGFLLGLLPLWNGSVYVTAALVLSGFFLLLPLRPYLVGLGAAAAIFGLPQLLLWRTGGQSYTGIFLGYVVDNPTPESVAKYLGFTFGLKWLLLVVALVLVRRLGRVMIVSSLSLVVFAFTVQLSREVAANHKFMFIWEALVNLFAAYVIWRVGRKGILGAVAAVILTLSITLSGFIDIFPLVHDNKIELRIENDRLADWLHKETSPRDLFLTHRAVTHPILFTGRKIFFGYEYYAWSVGYPVEERAILYRRLYEERDPATLFRLLRETGIRYVTFDAFLAQSDQAFNLNEDVHRQYSRLVYEDTEGHHGSIRIFEVPAPGSQVLAGLPAPSPQPTAPSNPILGRTRLGRPLGSTVLATGDVLVADAQLGRIVRVGPDGALLDTFGPAGYKEPNGVAVDSAGFVYVADTWNHRVQKLSPEGDPVLVLPSPPSLYAPRDVAIGPDDHVFVTNTGMSQIVRYDPAGGVLLQWGTTGTGPGQFHEPCALAVGGGEVFVADYLNARVQVFSLDGVFRRTWAIREWQNAPRWHRPGITLFGDVVYVASPTTASVLAFTREGEPRPALSAPGVQELSGLSVSPDGTLFGSDGPTGKIVGMTLPRPAPRRRR
jgi:hypothetical protein